MRQLAVLWFALEPVALTLNRTQMLWLISSIRPDEGGLATDQDGAMAGMFVVRLSARNKRWIAVIGVCVAALGIHRWAALGASLWLGLPVWVLALIVLQALLTLTAALLARS